MPRVAAGVLAMVVLAGCTRVVDDPRPVRAWPVAPITAGQVTDVLSARARPEAESNLFLTVEPEECAGMAREVDPPFLFGVGVTPAARGGGQWFAEDNFSIQEMAAVYPANFDARRSAGDARRTIDDCRDKQLTVITTEDNELSFRSLPAAESPSAEIVLWSLTGTKRSCDNAYVAAYNAAIEITACGDRNGYNVSALAEEALGRLHALANMTS
ncbi:hypothetical protein FHR72_001313 [Mycolicibacterium iranicum]|uniref:PknH-like extracellular domain-containing protein n=1 Tax=Mycolicibacterium iranicum TaxID=912594 RepID=A0A839Q102_MYCIR|nr:sensor domain-containing protein [Mycolicibacterium iranicum]MBB2989850.1 hypothetical protein [Mycolicibacterium iranicum]